MAWPYQEAVAATILRAVHGRAQLCEQVVNLWPDHFDALAIDDSKFGCTLPVYGRGTIGPRVLGDTRDLPEAVASSPAALIYRWR